MEPLFFSIAMQRYSFFLKLQNVCRLFYKIFYIFFVFARFTPKKGVILLFYGRFLEISEWLLFDKAIVEHIPSERDTCTNISGERTVMREVGTYDKCRESADDGELLDV